MPAPADLATAKARRVDVLRLIRTAVATNGYPPSISEISKATGVSTLTTRRDLERLERDGSIERDPKVTRGIRVL
jgi:repressor LexA